MGQHNVDTLLRSIWSKSMTNSQFDEVCGITDNIEIYNLRSVKSVRVKTRTFGPWKGAFLRKSIPLCSGYRIAYYNGRLTNDKINTLSKYKGKMTQSSKLLD